MWWKLELKFVLTPCGNKKVGLHPLICGANQTCKLYQHPMAIRKLGYIHLYVVQIRPKNYIKAQGINKIWQLLEKNLNLKRKENIWKVLTKSSKRQRLWWKSFKKQVKKLQENIKKNGKRVSMEHQSPSLWGVANLFSFQNFWTPSLCPSFWQPIDLVLKTLACLKK